MNDEGTNSRAAGIQQRSHGAGVCEVQIDRENMERLQIVFVVPLRSPKTARSWTLVSTLFQRTLASLENQSCPDWHCVLVCNSPPEGVKAGRRLSIIEKDFPIPTTPMECMNDKGRKKEVGLEAAQSMSPHYVMCLDADDLLHRELVEFVRSNSAPHSRGWLINKGYDWAGGRFAARRSTDFHDRCGSCTVLRTKDLSEDPGLFMCSHTEVNSYCENKGGRLVPVPFHAAVHVLETGENHVRNNPVFRVSGVRSALRTVGCMHLVNRGFRRAFALEQPSRP